MSAPAAPIARAPRLADALPLLERIVAAEHASFADALHVVSALAPPEREQARDWLAARAARWPPEERRVSVTEHDPSLWSLGGVLHVEGGARRVAALLERDLSSSKGSC